VIAYQDGGGRLEEKIWRDSKERRSLAGGDVGPLITASVVGGLLRLRKNNRKKGERKETLQMARIPIRLLEFPGEEDAGFLGQGGDQ